MTTAIAMGRRYQVSVILDPDQIEDLDRRAAQQRTSRAAVLRAAVDVYLAERRDLPRAAQADEEPA